MVSIVPLAGTVVAINPDIAVAAIRTVLSKTTRNRALRPAGRAPRAARGFHQELQ